MIFLEDNWQYKSRNLKCVYPEGRMITIAEVCPKKQEVRARHWAPQPTGPQVLHWEDKPLNDWLWGQWDLNMRKPRDCRKERLHSVRTHKKKPHTHTHTHFLCPSAEADLKETWVRPTCLSQRISRQSGGNWDFPWWHRSWKQPFWGLILPRGHLC